MSGSCLISAFGLVLIFSQIAYLSAQVAPVLLFGGESLEPVKSVDALGRISSNEFAEIVSKKVGGSRAPIVVFAKDNLCVEHLSQQKLKLNTSEINYFPSVEWPLSTFESLESYNVTREEKPETIANHQVIIFSVSNLADVSELYGELRSKSPNLIGAITGASCSYSRFERTRRAITSRVGDEIIVAADRVLLYTTEEIEYKIGVDAEYTTLGQPTSYSSFANDSESVHLDLVFAPANSSEITLRLQFSATTSKYWYFNSVEYETNSSVLTLTSDSNIFFPYNFSYHCTKDIIFYNGTTFVNFTDIQVQIDPPASTTNDTAAFSDAYDCIGFTSIPIWSGIFVTAILALIIIWGLTMIMDIRTMDRFDDPKGKTITTAVTE